MSKIYKVKDLMDVANHGKVPPPCDETMKLTVKSAHNGVSQGTWQVDESFINGLGVAMGGFLSSASDIMMAYAIASLLEEDQGFASIDLHTTFHRPVGLGEVEIEARVERKGRTVSYLVAELTQHGKKVATSVSSMLIK